MKPEPLKNKEKRFMYLDKENKPININTFGFSKTSVEEAVEWLKKEVVSKRMIFDSITERNILKKIDKAFEDCVKK